MTPLPRFSVREFEIFLVVAKKKSFRKAAKPLGITPEAVSLAVSAMETKLGHHLVRRPGTTTSPSYLTMGGWDLFFCSKTVVRNVRKAVAKIATRVESEDIAAMEEACAQV